MGRRPFDSAQGKHAPAPRRLGGGDAETSPPYKTAFTPTIKGALTTKSRFAFGPATAP
jgi:hypothetical protein